MKSNPSGKLYLITFIYLYVQPTNDLWLITRTHKEILKIDYKETDDQISSISERQKAGIFTEVNRSEQSIYMKMCEILFVIREMLIKTTMRHCSIRQRIRIIKQILPNVTKCIQQLEPSHIGRRMIKPPCEIASQ